MGVDVAIYVMIVVAILAAAASAYAMHQQGQQQKKIYKRQEEMMREQADMAKKIGQSRADDIRARNRAALAKMQAETGAMGVADTAGTSPLAVMAYSAREMELDALRAEWSGDADARAHNADAIMARFYGRNAEYSSNIGAGATLLGGFSRAGQMYYGATGSTGGGGAITANTTGGGPAQSA